MFSCFFSYLSVFAIRNSLQRRKGFAGFFFFLVFIKEEKNKNASSPETHHQDASSSVHGDTTKIDDIPGLSDTSPDLSLSIQFPSKI